MESINFYGAHVQTLSDLNELAKKHNCTITFGIDNLFDRGADWSIYNCPKRIINELENKGSVNYDEDLTTGIRYWFELYDKTKDVSNTLTYTKGFAKRVYEVDYDQELSESAKNWIEEILLDWQDISDDDKYELWTDFGGTTMTGFKGRKKPDVYREGMLLKFFGDLVCEYLHEPYIVRTY